MKDCLFCDRNSLAKTATFENKKNFRIILDPFPVNFGHFLIVPKQHVNRIDDLNGVEFNKLQELILECKSTKRKAIRERYNKILKLGPKNKSEKLIEDALSQEDSPAGFNIGINEGKAAGQTINHLHIHVIPRYEGDVENPEGGVRNVIHEKADYT